MPIDSSHTTNNDNESPSIITDDKPFIFVNKYPLYFQEDWKQGIGGGLWSTGLAMGHYFASHFQSLRNNLRRLSSQDDGSIRALELGSGNGFLSLCFLAAVTGENSISGGILSELVITDQQDHLPFIQQHLDKNKHLLDNCVCTRIILEEHSWGEFSSWKLSHKYDFIFGSDLAYHESLYNPLISSLKRFSHDGTVTLLGVTMNDTCPKFFDLLWENGFAYKRLDDYLMEKDFRGTTFGIFAIQLRPNT